MIENNKLIEQLKAKDENFNTFCVSILDELQELGRLQHAQNEIQIMIKKIEEDMKNSNDDSLNNNLLEQRKELISEIENNRQRIKMNIKDWLNKLHENKKEQEKNWNNIINITSSYAMLIYNISEYDKKKNNIDFNADLVFQVENLYSDLDKINALYQKICETDDALTDDLLRRKFENESSEDYLKELKRFYHLEEKEEEDLTSLMDDFINMKSTSLEEENYMSFEEAVKTNETIPSSVVPNEEPKMEQVLEETKEKLLPAIPDTRILEKQVEEIVKENPLGFALNVPSERIQEGHREEITVDEEKNDNLFNEFINKSNKIKTNDLLERLKRYRQVLYDELKLFDTNKEVQKIILKELKRLSAIIQSELTNKPDKDYGIPELNEPKESIIEKLLKNHQEDFQKVNDEMKESDKENMFEALETFNSNKEEVIISNAETSSLDNEETTEKIVKAEIVEAPKETVEDLLENLNVILDKLYRLTDKKFFLKELNKTIKRLYQVKRKLDIEKAKNIKKNSKKILVLARYSIISKFVGIKTEGLKLLGNQLLDLRKEESNLPSIPDDKEINYPKIGSTFTLKTPIVYSANFLNHGFEEGISGCVLYQPDELRTTDYVYIKTKEGNYIKSYDDETTFMNIKNGGSVIGRGDNLEGCFKESNVIERERTQSL